MRIEMRSQSCKFTMANNVQRTDPLHKPISAIKVAVRQDHRAATSANNDCTNVSLHTDNPATLTYKQIEV